MVARPTRSTTAIPGGRALALGLVLGLAACEIPRPSMLGAAPFLLDSAGGYVLSDAPPGVEVLLNSKPVRPAGGSTAPNASSPGPAAAPR